MKTIKTLLLAIVMVAGMSLPAAAQFRFGVRAGVAAVSYTHLDVYKRQGVAFIHFLTQVAVVGILKQRKAARRMECEHPFAFFAACLCLFCRYSNTCGRKSGELRLVVDNKLKRIGGV